MEIEEAWNRFLHKKVNIIVNDPPGDIPKKKSGTIIGFTETHLFLEQNNGEEIALLLEHIRRIEPTNNKEAQK